MPIFRLLKFFAWKSPIAIFFWMAFSSFGPFKAESFRQIWLEAKFGALLAYKGTSNCFTLRFEGKNVQPTQNPGFIVVDNHPIQATLIPFQKDFGFPNLDVEKQKELLTRYKNFEKKHVESALKTRILDADGFLMIKNRVFKTWTYQMPTSHKSISKQIYLMCICFDQILVLNAPVGKEESGNLVHNQLENIASTLELYPNTLLDVENLAKQLKE
jgi:hypothetical protein